LKPSGQTPTSSPPDSSRSASALQARVLPALRASGATTGSVKTRSAPSIRRWRCAGWWSSSASAVITASIGIVPEWFGHDQRAADVRHVVQAAGLDRNHFSYSGRSGGSSTCSVRSGVEAEVVDLVVAGEPAAQEGQPAGELALAGGRRPAGGSGRRAGRGAAALPRAARAG
jgi:hypothetical protein